jgi:hypothetical protein
MEKGEGVDKVLIKAEGFRGQATTIEARLFF